MKLNNSTREIKHNSAGLVSPEHINECGINTHSDSGNIISGGIGEIAEGRSVGWVITEKDGAYKALVGVITVFSPEFHTEDLSSALGALKKSVSDLEQRFVVFDATAVKWMEEQEALLASAGRHANEALRLLAEIKVEDECPQLLSDFSPTAPS